jgi:hypothetical protein
MNIDYENDLTNVIVVHNINVWIIAIMYILTITPLKSTCTFNLLYYSKSVS